MGLNSITSLAIITLMSSCSARVISKDVIASVLQDIMSPANTGKAMQLINMAASRANNRPIPNIASAGDNCGLPARAMFARNELNPEIVYPGQRKMLRQAVREVPNMESLLLPGDAYLSASLAAQQNFARPCSPASTPQYFSAPSVMSNPCLPVTSPPNPYLSTPYPGPSPFPSFAPNPYMPVASPVSALSLFSSDFPPPTQSKGQFLKKIPIPPPTL